jgi:hypothetical protein
MMILIPKEWGWTVRYGVPGSRKPADVTLPTSLNPEAREVQETTRQEEVRILNSAHSR